MATTVDQIRRALTKRDGISGESMRPLAAAYADEISRVNSRLSSAVELLHKGLRSEAIQSASIPPNAIDSAAKLDLPDAEREEWFDILQFLEIPVPSTLDRDLVEQLNEAIVEIQPLEELLKRQRRLAIARAPLAWRLKVLHRIAEVDPITPVWEEDIESWEKVRRQQLAGEAQTAIASANPDALRALKDELSRSDWRSPPNPNMLKQVSAKLAGLADQQTLSELKEVATKMNDAFCQFEEPAARQQLTQWNELNRQLSSPLPPELQDEVEPAIAWLSEVDREFESRAQRASAIGALEAMLDRKASIHDLEKSYQQTTLFDEPPPDELLQRYRVALEDRQMTKKRQFLSVIAAIVAATLISIMAFAWWQIDAAQKDRARVAEDKLQSLVDQGDLDGANDFYSKLTVVDPELAASSAILSINASVQSQIKDRQQRAQQFETYLTAADSQDDAAIDLSALNKAETLAETEEQKGRVFAVRTRHLAWEAGIATQQTESMLTDLTRIRSELTQVENGDGGSQASSQLDELIEQLRALPATYPRASPAAKSQVNSAQSRASAMGKAVFQRSQRMKVREDAIAAVLTARSLIQLASELQRSAKVLEDASIAGEFARSAGERELWEKALQWNDYIDTVSVSLADGLKATEVKKIQSAKTVFDNACEQTLMKLPSVWNDRIDRYDERSSMLERVLGGLPNTVIADLYTIRGDDGKGERYFVYKSFYDRNKGNSLAPSGEGVKKNPGVEIIANDSGAVETIGLRGDFTITQEPYASIRELVSVYQSRRDTFMRDWDGEFLSLMANLRGRKDLDGKIKEILLQHLLNGGCDGSEYLTKTLAEDLRWLQSRNEEVSNWHEAAMPNNSLDPAVEARVIQRLKRVYQQRPQLDVKSASVRNLKFDWIGVLTRDEEGTVSVNQRVGAHGDGNLAIVRALPSDSKKAEWVSIGRMRSGKVDLSLSKPIWIAGRPVFLYPDSQ